MFLNFCTTSLHKILCFKIISNKLGSSDTNFRMTSKFDFNYAPANCIKERRLNFLKWLFIHYNLMLIAYFSELKIKQVLKY